MADGSGNHDPTQFLAISVTGVVHATSLYTLDTPRRSPLPRELSGTFMHMEATATRRCFPSIGSVDPRLMETRKKAGKRWELLLAQEGARRLGWKARASAPLSLHDDEPPPPRDPTPPHNGELHV